MRRCNPDDDARFVHIARVLAALSTQLLREPVSAVANPMTLADGTHTVQRERKNESCARVLEAHTAHRHV